MSEKILAMAAATAAVLWGASAAEYDPHAGRCLVWGDEFDGTDLDVTKWNFRQTMTTAEAVYDNGPSTVRVEDGVLKMMVGRSGNASKPWLLPQGVTTADGMAFKYGYLEMRARLPFRDGAWSSFWMQSTEALRKANYMAEVDIFECASTNSLGTTLHKWLLGSTRLHDKMAMGGYRFENADNISEEYHVYGLEWSPSEMSLYVDGIRCCTRAIDSANDFGSQLPGMDGFRDYMFVILNNEIFTPTSSAVVHDGLSPLPDDTPLPVNYWVDWIRLYQNPSCEFMCAKTADGLSIRHSPLEAWTGGENPAVDSLGATWTASRREKANDPIASGALLAKRVQTSRKVGFAVNDESGIEVFAVRGDGAYEDGGCVFSPGEIVFKPTSRGWGNWRAVLTFEVPRSGWYAMSARFRAADTTAAGKVDTSVLVGGQVLQQEELVRSGDGQPCRGHACTFAHRFLPKGTQIEFVVGPGWEDSKEETWWYGHLNDATALTLLIVEEKGLGDEAHLSVADLGRAIGDLTVQTSGSAGTFSDESALGTWSLCHFARTQSVADETSRIPLSRVLANDVGTRGVVFRSSVSDAVDPQVKINGGERASELSVTERKWVCPYDTVAPGEVLVNPYDGQCVGIRFVPEHAGGYVVSVKARDLAMSQDTAGTWGHSGVDVTLAVNGRGLASSRVSAELLSASGCYQWMFAQTDVLPLQGGVPIDIVIDPRDSAARDFTGLSVQIFKVSSSASGLPTAFALQANLPLGATNRIDSAFVEELGTMDLVKNGRGVLWSSSAMANYAGRITIAEGALMVSGSSDLGTTVGTTEVKPGATLILYTGAGIEGSAAADSLALSEDISVGGTGDSQWGAAIYQPAGSSSQQKAFAGKVFLTEDTTFAMMLRAGFTGGELYMRGHTLTLNGGVFNFQRSRMTPRETSDVGDIVVERGTFQIGGDVSGQFGDPARTVTVKDGASLTFYDAAQVPVWRLLVEEGGKVAVNGSSAATANAVWGGDVEWDSSAVGASVITRADGGTLTFKGAVTGAGTMRAARGTIVFEKSCADTLGIDATNARVVLPSADNYLWGHGGLMIGHRSDNWPAGYDSDRSDTDWSYCADGPGPQVDRSYWATSGKECWCSRGYIWNRGDADVTWSFFCGGVYENWILIDGTQVYYNKRDSWGSASVTLTPGPHRIDIRTSNGNAYGGPRTDNDKFKINGVISFDTGNGYLFTTDTVSRAEVLLENTYRKSNFTFGDDATLDVNGMPIELTNLNGFVTVTNAMTCKVKGTWSIKASDIGHGLLIATGDCPLTFDNVSLVVDDVDAIPRTQKHWDLCTAESIVGFPAGTVLEGQNSVWKLAVGADGKTIGLDYRPKGAILIFW